MRKVFEAELSSKNGCTQLTLPAGSHALLDALERLRLEPGETPRWELLSAYDAGYIFQHMDQDNGSLLELNALAQRFAQLDGAEITVFEGLAAMERVPVGQPIPLPRLIDLAYSTDCCHLVEGVVTDAQLGRFCAENGFAPEAEICLTRRLSCWTSGKSAGSSGRPRAACSPGAAMSSGGRS